jgi:hypothetical protein
MAYNRHARDDAPDTGAGAAHAALLAFLEQKLKPSDLDEAQLLVEALFQAGQEQPGGAKIGTSPQLGGGAMDASLRHYAFDSADPVRRMQDVRAAEAEVSPVVGPVVGMDSANEIFREALRQLGVDTWKIHPSALPALFRHARATGARRSVPAMDSASAADVARRFPGAANIKLA